MSDSKDYRMSFIRGVESSLVNQFTPEQIAMISNVVTVTLADYEITERCTDLIPLDDINERLVKRYCACLVVDGKSEKTIYQYKRTLMRLSDTLKKPFTEMGAYDVRFFLAMELNRGLKQTSVENLRANISAFFQWMTDEEVIPKNPISKIKPGKCPIEVKKPFSDIELDALRSACGTTRERAIVEMLISTGVRVSELAGMEVQDINTGTMAVHVVHGKGAKERMTYTTPVALKHLLAYLNERPEETTALFCNEKHGILNPGGIRVILNRIADRAGVENVHPHRFRRTFATKLAKRGMDIQEIQRLLGHNSLNTTMKYVTMDDTKVQASYNKFIA